MIPPLDGLQPLRRNHGRDDSTEAARLWREGAAIFSGYRIQQRWQSDSALPSRVEAKWRRRIESYILWANRRIDIGGEWRSALIGVPQLEVRGVCRGVRLSHLLCEISPAIPTPADSVADAVHPLSGQ